MFVSSADMNLLLLIAPKLRLTPLHALHDTSNIIVHAVFSQEGLEIVATYILCVYSYLFNDIMQ